MIGCYASAYPPAISGGRCAASVLPTHDVSRHSMRRTSGCYLQLSVGQQLPNYHFSVVAGFAFLGLHLSVRGERPL